MTYAKLIRKPKPNATTKPKAVPHAVELRRTPTHGTVAELREATVLPKLKIGGANDPLEREADVVAAEVMQMYTPEFAARRPWPNASRPNTQLARMPTPVESEQVDETRAPDFSLRNLARRGGTPLPTQVRSFLEPRFGVGLGAFSSCDLFG